MVADPLVEADQQGQVDDLGVGVGVLTAAGDLAGDLEHQIIELVIALLDLGREGEVAAGDDLGGPLERGDAEIRHAADLLAVLLGHGRVGVRPASGQRDVSGQVAHALERGAHAQARDQQSQVGGHRGLARQQLDRLGVELDLTGIDVGVGGDDPLRQGEIALEQGGGRVLEGRPDQIGHVDQVVDDMPQVALVRLAHVYYSSV